MSADLKVLTYNCWHALTAKNLIEFRELEPPGRKLERYKIQIDNLRSVDADIVLLQEVSPIKDRIREFESLGYEVCSQVDQSGVKFFGLGLPANLSTGLCILAKPEFHLKKLFGAKLSGNLGFTGVDFSFQVTENRYALLASSQHKDFGKTLIVCTHLHHGTENTPLIETMLTRALQAGIINSDEIEISRAEIKAADLRRRNELDILFAAIHVLEKDLDQIILGGDLNSSESSQAYTQILFEGFFDTYRSCHAEANSKDYSGFTWDIVKNKENISFGHDFELPMSSFGRADVKELFNNYNDRQRRIDFLFLKLLKSTKLKAASGGVPLVSIAEVLKFNSPEDAKQHSIFGSDHMGVLSKLVGKKG